MVYRKKRKDTKIDNISGIPDQVKKKYRSDSHLDTILGREHVTTLHQLKKKYQDNSRC